MILAVDTSLGSTVAVIDLAGVVLAEAASENPLGHAEVIGTLIAAVLDEAGRPDITHVAAGMGPGPFTGLRIGIAAARTFAMARGAQVVPVVSHDAIALPLLDTDPERRFVVQTDARRRELAWTTYTGLDTDRLPVREAGPGLVARAHAEAELEDWEPILAEALSAGALGIVASRAINAGRTIAPHEPLYLRSPDVTQPKAMP